MRIAEKLFGSTLSTAVMLCCAALFLAANHVIGRGVHEWLPPVGLSFWRWVLAAFMLLPFIYKRLPYTLKVLRAKLGLFLLLGGLMIGSTTAILVALNFTTAINTSLVNALQPVFTVTIAWLFFSRPLQPRQWLGIASATFGVTLMICRGSLATLLTLDFNIGDVIAILSMSGFSAYAVNIFRLPADLGPAEQLFGIILGGSALLLPFYIAETMFYTPMPFNALALKAVLSLAILVSFLSMLIWNLGNQAIGPERASVFINLIPIFAAILAVIFLGESFLWFHLVGLVLVICGIFLVLRLRASSPRAGEIRGR